jgi:hypothetical protein
MIIEDKMRYQNKDNFNKDNPAYRIDLVINLFKIVILPLSIILIMAIKKSYGSNFNILSPWKKSGSDVTTIVPTDKVGIGLDVNDDPNATLEIEGRADLSHLRIKSVSGQSIYNPIIRIVDPNNIDLCWINTNDPSNILVGNSVGTGTFSSDDIRNTVIGSSAGYNLQDDDNTLIGYYAGYNENDYTLTRNVMIGSEAGYFGAQGDNVYTGYRSGRYNYGSSNVIIGSQAGQADPNNPSDSIGAIIIGAGAGSNYSGSGGSIIIGTSAGQICQSGVNTFIGRNVAAGNTTGTRNTFLGEQAGIWNETTNDNVFVGEATGGFNQGSRNTMLGTEAGMGTGAYAGNDDVFLGYKAGYNETGSEKLYIDNSSAVNPLIYGEFDSNFVNFPKIGINLQKTAPNNLFEIKSAGVTTWPLNIKASDGEQLAYFYETNGGDGLLALSDTNGVDRIVFNSFGDSYINPSFASSKFGIHTTTPASTLDVVGTGQFSSTLTFAGSAANIALGSNFLSYDGTDDGINIDSAGNLDLNNNDIEEVDDIACKTISSADGADIEIVLGASSGDDLNVDGITLTVEGDDGQVGVGYSDPLHKFDVLSTSTNSCARFTEVSSETTGERNVLKIKADSLTGPLSDGFGPQILWKIDADSVVEEDIGLMSFVRDGANNSGKMRLLTYNEGVANTGIVMDYLGNVGIATSEPNATLDIAGNARITGNLISSLFPNHYQRDTRWMIKGYSDPNDRYIVQSPNTLAIDISGSIYFLNSQSSYDLSTLATWDSNTPNYKSAASRSGKNFYIYACVPTSGNAPKIVMSANSTVPSGYTSSNSRKIGGLHCLCVDVGTISGHTLTDFKAGDILPESIWDLRHRPISYPEGMVWSSRANIWTDIYLQSGTGLSTASIYSATITDTRNWMDFVDDLSMVSKKLLTDSEFQIISRGSNQETNISGSADPVTTGGHVDTAGRRMISAIGVEDCCGAMWQWLQDQSYRFDGGVNHTHQVTVSGDPQTVTSENPSVDVAPVFGWYDLGTEGSLYRQGTYGDIKLRAGGSWGNGSACGSRSRGASDYRWASLSTLGARGRSEPKYSD